MKRRLRRPVVQEEAHRGLERPAMAAVLALALGLLLLVALTRLAGAAEPDPAGQLRSGGPEGLLGLDEQALIRLLGEPEGRDALGADLQLSYGGAVPVTLTLSGEVCTAVTVQGLALLGVEPGMEVSQARAVLSQAGIHWLDNAFDPAYAGGGVRSPELGWLAAYSGGYLYEFCYDRDASLQTVHSVRVGEGAPLEEPNNLFCAPQLAECLEGIDPIALLGMTMEEVRVRWGFAGNTLSLTAGYTAAGPGGLLSCDPAARYGYGEGELSYGCTGDYGYHTSGRCLMLVTQSAQLPVLGLVPGITTAQEAADILALQGGVECTLAAAPVLEQGAVYAQLDPELLEPADPEGERLVYLTPSWYVELRFDGGVLSRAAFCLLEEMPDLTPPEPSPEEPEDNLNEVLPEEPETEESGQETPEGEHLDNISGGSGSQETPAQGGQWTPPTEDTTPVFPESNTPSQSGWRAFTVGGATFSLLLPEGWDQKCTAVQTTDSLTLYDAQGYQTQWGGVLLTIRCYADGEDYTGQTAYRVLGQTSSGTLVAIYPTQVQYNTGDGTAAQRYQQLSDTLSGILDSLRLISG